MDRCVELDKVDTLLGVGVRAVPWIGGGRHGRGGARNAARAYPVSVHLGVDRLVTQQAPVVPTGAAVRSRIDPELEAQAMQMIGHQLEPVVRAGLGGRELLRVDLDPAVRQPRRHGLAGTGTGRSELGAGRPAVVKQHVAVAEVPEASAHQPAGRILERPGRDVEG